MQKDVSAQRIFASGVFGLSMLMMVSPVLYLALALRFWLSGWSVDHAGAIAAGLIVAGCGSYLYIEARAWASKLAYRKFTLHKFVQGMHEISHSFYKAAGLTELQQQVLDTRLSLLEFAEPRRRP